MLLRMSKSSAARRTTATETERKIPLKNGLPAIPHDDIEFVCRALALLQNEKGEVIGVGSITDVVRSLGLPDRTLGSSGAPTSQYLRVRVALLRAKEEGRVECECGRWWVKTT